MAGNTRFGRGGGPQGLLYGLQQLNRLLFGAARGPDRRVTLHANVAEEDPACLGLRGNTTDYYNPSNSYIDNVLGTGLGIPISLAVIHSAVGRRAGLPIQMVGVPTHFLTKIGDENAPEERFVDVFDHGRTMTRAEVAEFVRSMGTEFFPRLLVPTPPSGVWARMCRNLLISYGEIRREGESVRSQRRNQQQLLPLTNLLLTITPDDMNLLLQRVQLLLAVPDFDAALGELNRLKLLAGRREGNGADGGVLALLQQYLQRAEEMQEEHRFWSSKQWTPRAAHLERRVGDIVWHLRYHYRGVVFGWDEKCSANEEWISQMQVDRLPRGRHQPFYHVLVDERTSALSSTYVAQENLTSAADTSAVQHEDIGLYFKGWLRGSYVPNDYARFRYPADFEHRQYAAGAVPGQGGGGGGGRQGGGSALPDGEPGSPGGGMEAGAPRGAPEGRAGQGGQVAAPQRGDAAGLGLDELHVATG